MPKATMRFAKGNNQLPQPEEMVPSSQEELSRSEQEPNPEFLFPQFRPPKPVSHIFMLYI